MLSCLPYHFLYLRDITHFGTSELILGATSIELVSIKNRWNKHQRHLLHSLVSVQYHQLFLREYLEQKLVQHQISALFYIVSSVQPTANSQYHFPINYSLFEISFFRSWHGNFFVLICIHVVYSVYTWYSIYNFCQGAVIVKRLSNPERTGANRHVAQNNTS